MAQQDDFDETIINKRSRKVYQYNSDGKFVAEFPSLTHACKATNSGITNVYQCCKGDLKSTNGTTFRFERLEKVNPFYSHEEYMSKFPNRFEFPYTKDISTNYKRRKIECVLGGEDGDCWECVSHTRNPAGYPEISINGKKWLMNRFSYTLCNKKKIERDMVVMHSCDNPSCINPKHLSEGTSKDNHDDMTRKRRGSKPPRNQLLTDEQVMEIFKSKESMKDIAKKYGVHNSTVSSIKTGKTWSSVTGKKYIKRKPLTDDEIVGIYQSEGKLSEVGRIYGVTISTVSSIRKGRLHSAVLKERLGI